MTKNYTQNRIASNGMKKKNIIKIIITLSLLLFFLGSSPAQAQFPAAAVGKACVLKNPDGSFTQQPFSCTTPPGGAIGKTCYIVGVFIPGSTTEQVNFTCQYPTGTVFGTCTRPGIIPTQTAQWNCPSPGVWTADPRQTPACSPFYVFSTTQNKCVPQTSNYEFLAPLPDPFGTQGELLKNIDTAGGNALGRYLNIIIRLAIGFAAVLAMIMIVMGGIQYMTSELVSSKEDGKNRINNAILGLLVALGAWLILFTINPQLLNTNVNITPTIIAYTEMPIISDTGALPGVTSGCPAGVQKTIIDMFACGDILQSVNNMLIAARTAGFNITGGGYRSIAQQTQLRIANCNGNTTNANARCTPETALPGRSNHNHGKAFDLRCDGESIQATDNKCFIWLKANAGTYGLRNLTSEPWHWSVDGR